MYMYSYFLRGRKVVATASACNSSTFPNGIYQHIYVNSILVLCEVLEVKCSFYSCFGNCQKFLEISSTTWSCMCIRKDTYNIFLRSNRLPNTTAQSDFVTEIEQYLLPNFSSVSLTLLKFTRRIGIILFGPLSLSKYECQRFNVSKSVNTLVTSLKGLKQSLACCWTWKICLSYRKRRKAIQGPYSLFASAKYKMGKRPQ